MPTNRPSEDRYINNGYEFEASGERKVQPQMTDEEVEAHNNRIMGRANRRSVIDKLTAPPETVRGHLNRLGVRWNEMDINGEVVVVISAADLEEAEKK